MRFVIRGLLIAAVCGLGGAGMLGCQENNETNAKISSTAPPPGVTQPKTLDDYAKQQQQQQAQMKKGMAGYPTPKR